MAGDPQPTPEQVAEQRTTAHRDLVRAYKRLFTSDDGRRVLADLEEKYGFDRDDYVYGCTPGDHAYRSGLKSPIRYIRKMRDSALPVLGDKPRKLKARSGATPQPPTESQP